MSESINNVTKRKDSRYTLVIAASKRARQLLSGSEPKVETKHCKPVTVALAEMEAGKVQWRQTKEGIK